MNEEQMKHIANLISQDIEKDKEIERLNNIIEELEKKLEKTWLEYKDTESEDLYTIAFEDKNILDYLQELKERK